MGRKTSFSWNILTSLFKPRKKTVPRKLKQEGSTHNLQELFEEVNAKYFSSSLSLQIGWSGYGKSNSRSSIRLGFYQPKREIIKINKLLDRPDIPRYFVSFIIYHEILHHILPPIETVGSRRKIHHCAFLNKEREFEEYEMSQAFLKQLKTQLFPSSYKKSLTRSLE